MGAVSRSAEDSAQHARRWGAEFAGREPEAILAWAAETFGDRIAFATSLGAEDQVLADLISRIEPKPAVFTLDTGRLFPETYDLLDRTEQRYRLGIKVMFPEAADVEHMVSTHGVNLFRTSVTARKRCCEVRKVAPLRKALNGLDAWITGLRREQSVARASVAAIEWDEANGLVKINPLVEWDESQVRQYLRDHDVPYNPLHDQGFPSIGCAPCTRAVPPGDDPRSGRWWWESREQRECGLHASAPSANSPSVEEME